MKSKCESCMYQQGCLYFCNVSNGESCENYKKEIRKESEDNTYKEDPFLIPESIIFRT